MPLREDLLEPVSGDNPSGKYLRYERVYDQIKEARTEEDETLPAGAWERTAKRADYRLVIKLAGDALATKSKDLQLAAWLGEAHISQEGVSLLVPVLKLMLDLQTGFWETIYPEIDEGDTGLRAVPLQWAANRYATLVYALPLTKSGVDFHTYKAARSLGYEADAVNNDAKRAARAAAVKRGQLTAEDIDTAIAGSPKKFYVDLTEPLGEAREILEDLAMYCEEQYGDDGPSFRKLRDSLEEVHNLANSLLSEKRKLEPDVTAAPEPPAEPAVAESTPAIPETPIAAPIVQAAAPVAVPTPVATSVPPPAPAPPASTVAAPAASAGVSSTPQSWDDAVSTIQACASYMSAQRRGSAVPYLLQTSIRWGELRKSAPKPGADLLVAPSGEERQSMMAAYAAKQWSDLLERGMRLVSQPCGRAWLDLHRYIWTAAKEMGFQAFASMVLRSVSTLVADFPELPQWLLTDDTPAADPETSAWLSAEVLQGSADSPATMATAPPVAAAPTIAPLVSTESYQPQTNVGAGRDGTEDVSAEAATLAASGDLRAAIVLLARDAEQQVSGRVRYQRRTQIAELCLRGGSLGVARPLLRELVEELERRNLDSWESGDLLTKPIALLLQSGDDTLKASDRDGLFSRLCRLDPIAALAVSL